MLFLAKSSVDSLKLVSQTLETFLPKLLVLGPLSLLGAFLMTRHPVVFDPVLVQSGVAQLMSASKSDDKASVAAHLAQVQAKQGAGYV
jgi:hypothetical protein